jgi:hypothetical protein
MADAQAEAETNDHLCSLCPRTDHQRARVPPPPALEDAPMSDLRCGHQVHTHCLMNELSEKRQRAECAECQITVMRDEAVAFYRERFEDYGNLRRQTVATLWANNEEFRNHVKEYKKLSGKMTTTRRVYAKETRVIKERFKQNVLTSIEVIKDQKRQATLELNALQSKKLYRRAAGAIQRKLNFFRRTWDVTSWSLRELNDIEGAPKIPRQMVFYRWHSSPKYIFRLKL